jgi:hypothetical protein
VTNVTKGGVTTGNKAAKSAGPKLGDPNALRAKLAEEKGSDRYVSFIGNADHLHLISPKPLYDDRGVRIGEDPGLYVDFQGVGRTREYDTELADDAAYVKRMRSIIEQKPRNNDVERLKIRELKPEDPTPPFARWDEFSADHIKVWLEAALTADNDANVRLVQEAARYEAANENRDDVLAVLSGLLATEAAVSDAFAVELKLK